MKPENEKRIKAVLSNMRASGLTQMIVSDSTTIFYLTGLRINPGERMLVLLLRTDGNLRLFVNELFGKPDCGLPVTSFCDTDDAPMQLVPYLDAKKTLGIDKNWPSRFLIRLLEASFVREVRNASICCDAARGIKSEAEQQAMRASSRVNDECMAAFAALVRPGLTERQMEKEICEIYAAHGCSSVSFTPICGFGPNAADPHHANDGTVLQKGQCVLIDVGGVLNDYCSDMTRTFFTAEPTGEERFVYELVRRAQETAEALVKPGIPLCDIDAAARNVITEAGYGPYFNHRLGHFIGLEDHEFGDVSPANHSLTKAGMCFSIEPGIYLPGKFGVRIEDVVLVTETGCEVLNHFSKDLTVLPL